MTTLWKPVGVCSWVCGAAPEGDSSLGGSGMGSAVGGERVALDPVEEV